MLIIPKITKKELMEALNQLTKLQAHYAGLLNEFDGGHRVGFVNGEAWILRLRELAKKTGGT